MTSDSCTPYPQQLLSIYDALDKIYTSISIISEFEVLPLEQTLGRILHETLFSPINLPQERNSAMDGFAFNSNDLNSTATKLHLVGTSWAGKPYLLPLESGTCVRIFTGAILPQGSDSIAIQEHVTPEGLVVYLPQNIKPRQHVREIGEDVKQGQLLLQAGKQLSAADIGLLAATGIEKIKVKRRIKIAFFSTGDELTLPGKTLSFGQIYDSNRYMLNALLQNPCITSTDLGIIQDSPQILQQTMQSAALEYDVIISTGGVSVGDADHVKNVLSKIGSIHLWKIAIKPGKPLAFGKINNCYFFGLPGNPAAVLTTFEQIVSPTLTYLGGALHKKPLRIKASCTKAIKKAPGRAEFQRGILETNAAYEFIVTPCASQGSNIMSTSSQANCFILLPAENAGVNMHEFVIVEPFSSKL